MQVSVDWTFMCILQNNVLQSTVAADVKSLFAYKHIVHHDIYL